MEFKDVKCRGEGCGTKTGPLFMRAPPRDSDDVWCQKCMDETKHMEEKK